MESGYVTAPIGSVPARRPVKIRIQHLIKRFRKPVVSTSANLSGAAAPAFFGEIAAEIKTGVDYVVHFRREDAVPRQPSSIVRWNADGTVTVIRP